MKPLAHVITATILLCASILAYAVNTGNVGRALGGVNDFLPRYAHARLIGTEQFYDIRAGYAEEERAAGIHLEGTYNDRLPWPALLMAPLCQLPYRTAYGIFIAANLLAFAVLVRVWLLKYDAVLWGVLYVPSAASILLGQEATVLAACLAVAVDSLEKRRDARAGVLLALCAVKPQLFLLLPIALVVHRRWRALAWASGTSVALLAVGTAAAGTDWPMRWWSVIKTLRDEAGPGYNLTGCPSLFQLGVSPATIAAGVLAAAIFTVCMQRASAIDRSFAFAIVGSTLVAPHAALYDLPVALVGAVALPSTGAMRWIRIAILTPVPYLALSRGVPWNSLLPVLLAAAGLIYAFQRAPISGWKRKAAAAGV
jgi:hypothetical protein